MRRTTAIAAAALLATAATACSSDSTAPAQGDKRRASSPDTKKHPATPSAGPLEFGTGHPWSDKDADGDPIQGTTTVISYTQPAKDVDLPDDLSDFPNPVWAVLEVKVCAKGANSFGASQGPWSLGFSDDTRLDAPHISGSGIPKPEYPVDGATVKPGSCLRGKLLFSVQRGTRPTQVIYAPDGDRDPVEWAVPKA